MVFQLVQKLQVKAPGMVALFQDVCCLEGMRHALHHQDSEGKKFSYTPYSGRISLDSDDDSGDSLSETSVELMADPEAATVQEPSAEEEPLYVLEIEINSDDLEVLTRHPKRASIWMSKKMQSKGKEHLWSKLSISQKKDFDLAQAKELSNVLQSKALRSLSDQGWANLDRRKIMQMRWLLTTKQDGTAKARLVVLGYQAHNITEVESAAPTMSRLSRNMLLAMCSNRGLQVRAGDVTSAFLQASQSLESEELYVWAPAELAVLFGADPSHPTIPLKVLRAFYGLIHSPRKWFEHITTTLKKIGWKPLLADPCVLH